MFTRTRVQQRAEAIADVPPTDTNVSESWVSQSNPFSTGCASTTHDVHTRDITGKTSAARPF